MKKMHLIILGILSILCSSCYSYKVHPKEYRKLENENPKRSAYIINDSLKKELKILKSSDLFNIIKDSSAADIKIKLYPIVQTPACGLGLMASTLTLGQFPVMLPGRYLYNFDEIENNKITGRSLHLNIQKRVWFWDMIVFNKNFEKKAGKAVLGVYQRWGY